MGAALRFDHVGITVTDLEQAVAFFAALGLQPDGEPMVVEGDFIDTVIAIPGSRTRIVMMRLPGADTTVELSSFERPDPLPAPTSSPANEPGLRSIAFEVGDLRAVVAHLADLGWDTVGGIGQHEDVWLMAYVRGPDAINVALAQRLG